MSDKHVYDYDVDLDSDSAAAQVIRFVKQGSRVLEIGAGPGSITRILTNKKDCHVTALEIDDDAIKILENYCERALKVDLNDPAWPEILKDDKFDAVIAADVLEHVYDPWKTLALMKGLLAKDGSIILSLPHVGHNALQAAIFSENFRYGDWGLLDRTHIRFFGIHNIQSLLNDTDLKIMESHFVMISPDATEFADIWANTPKNLQSALSENTFGNVYQVVTRSVPQNAAGDGQDLLAMPVEAPLPSVSNTVPVAIGGRLKNMARKYLSPEIKVKIHKAAKRLGVRL